MTIAAIDIRQVRISRTLTIFRFSLLIVAIAGALISFKKLPRFVIPLIAAIISYSSGAATLPELKVTYKLLLDPLAFLLAIVPLAFLLDTLGFFKEISKIISSRKRIIGGLWIFASIITATCNLDAAVVLLTPIYVNVAKSHDADPVAVGMIPAICAQVASSFLPISNLTNLIGVQKTGISPIVFFEHMSLPGLSATLISWFAYTKFVKPIKAKNVEKVKYDKSIVIVGCVVVFALLVGFVFGPSFGVKAFEVALAGDLFLILYLRKIPIKTLPIGTTLLALSLAILSISLLNPFHLGFLVDASTPYLTLRTIFTVGAASNLINNLPATMLSVHLLSPHATTALYATLIGANMGPFLLNIGSLSWLLWLAIMKNVGIKVSLKDTSRIGILVVGPAFLISSIVLVLITF